MASNNEDGDVVDVKKNTLARVSKKIIFVRNLPYEITEAEFESAFGDIGPIKRCFLIKDKDNKSKCRGFGYITFALEEDAQKAKDSVVTVKGRQVQITFSEKKPRLKRQKVGKDEDGDRNEAESKDNDNFKGRKLSVSDDEEKEIKIPSTEKSMSSPLKDEAKRKPKSKRKEAQSDTGRTVILTGLSGSVSSKQIYKRCRKTGELEKTTYPLEGREIPTAALLFKSYKDARQAVQKLNGRVFKGNTVNAVIQSKEQCMPSNRALRKSRLIVRNLSFRCTEAILKEMFDQYGEITEVSIPYEMKGKRKWQLGFGFVQFGSVFNAAKALKEINTKEILGRPVAVDWALSKAKYEAAKKLNDNEDGKVEEHSGSDDEVTQNKDEDADADDKDVGDSDDSLGMEKEDIKSEEEEDEEVEKEEELKQRKPSDVKEGLTVFIRNLSFDSTEQSISNLFKQFGDIAYCKVVVDPVTEHSKGSSFVKFKSADSVSNCLSIASGDGNSDGLHLDGYKLKVDIAVTRGKIEQLTKQIKEQKKEPQDKRNLYLAREGVIMPGSEAANELSKADLLRRQKAEAEKKVKLNNPNYFVSKTRLCVRNLPLKLSEKNLSKVFGEAAKDNRKPAKVTSVLIMRSKDRVDSSGKGRSLGFGFVEFANHKEALAALRSTNNSPSLFGPDRRPIVEFSIENSLALKARQQRLQRNKQKQQHVEKEKGLELKTNKERRKEKQDRRKEKRKAKRVRKGDQASENLDTVNGNNTGKTSNDTRGERTKDFSKKFKPKTPLMRKQRKHIQSDRNDGFDIDKPRKWPQGANNKANQETVSTQRLSLKPGRTAVTQRRGAKRKAREMEEESEFNQIVQNYKNKLFGDSAGSSKVKRSRWFE